MKKIIKAVKRIMRKSIYKPVRIKTLKDNSTFRIQPRSDAVIYCLDKLDRKTKTATFYSWRSYLTYTKPWDTLVYPVERAK